MNMIGHLRFLQMDTLQKPADRTFFGEVADHLTHDEKEVYAVISNTDLTEGRGKGFVKAYCYELSTARRVGHGGYIQTGNCPIEKHKLYAIEGTSYWHGPVDVLTMTEADKTNQTRLDAKTEVIRKMRAAGITENDIELLREK